MQWYVRFYLGRRCEDDERQVQRCESARRGFFCFAVVADGVVGLNLAGPTGTSGIPRHLVSSPRLIFFVSIGRFSRMLMKKIASHPGSGGAVVANAAVEDEDVGRVLRQVCWQWGLVMDRDEWRRRIEGGL